MLLLNVSGHCAENLVIMCWFMSKTAYLTDSFFPVTTPPPLQGTLPTLSQGGGARDEMRGSIGDMRSMSSFLVG